MKIWKKVASQVMDSVSGVRNRLYDQGVLSTWKPTVPVISIGNLTVGGTGKTPITLEVARALSEAGKKVGIVSRNYKASISTMAEVDALREQAAVYFGDEPTMLARSLPDVRVFVGPSKNRTARWALEQAPDLDVILVDDGFQHRALGRDLDLVLIDATDDDFHELLPLGRARENRKGLERADWIFLTKTNWVLPERIEWVRSLLPDDLPNNEVDFYIDWPELEKEIPIGVFAGIARPEVFFKLAKKKYFGQIQKTWPFRDHQKYGAEEIASLKEFLSRHPNAVLLTTEKDAVKIEDPEIHARLKILKMRIEIRDGEGFFEKLRSVVR